MSWDPIWEDIHASKEWGKYPTEELIRFVARHYYNWQPRNKTRFLDLGCGNGSATWYLCREGFSVSAIDGSQTAIVKLEKRLRSEGLSTELRTADAAELPYEDDCFDCIVELACLMHNDTDNTHKILKEAHRVLKQGGRFFSYTPQTGSWGDGIGEPAGRNTHKDAPEGPFAHMGVVRFSALEDVEEIYSPYFRLSVESVERFMTDRRNLAAFLVVTGLKK
jgi:SAM-dependent methyltransferase